MPDIGHATSEMLAVALRHANAGRPVFPCWPNKKPATPNGFHDATTDKQTIERWFANRFANSWLLAIPTGATSRWVVIDTHEYLGYESLRELEARYAPLPTTLSVNAARRMSLLLSASRRRIEIPCSVERLAENVDVRADGGYVIVPPSPGYHVDEMAPLADMPDWLLELTGTQHTGSSGERAPASEWVNIISGVEKGRRNESLARLAGHLLRHDVHIDVVTELAYVINNHRFQPPLEHKEVDGVVNSIAAAEQRRRTNNHQNRRHK